ncbi:MAG TPA: hypothetical protein VJV96_14425 [Candidatus Angelobacter sp.]|nr:hypothetical protein [Candidatus Angelobacter sp.]
MLKKLQVVAVVLLANVPLVAQFSPRPEQPESVPVKLTLDDLVIAAKKYFRDTAEFPMLQTTTFSVVSSSGRTSKPKIIFRNYLFRGYSRENRTANATITGGSESMWEVLRGSKLGKASANSVIWSMIPGLWLYSDPGAYTLTFGPAASGSEFLEAKMAPVNACPTLSMSHQNSKWYFPDNACGESEFQLDKDLRFKQFSFQALGLPAQVDLAPFGRCNLERYHAELEFQEVTLPQDKAPFLVPKRVTATLETDKGTVVISSIYGPKVEGETGKRH